MAIDSRDARSSSICPGSPWRGMLPLADGALTAPDRQHAAGLYRSLGLAVPQGGANDAERRRRMLLGYQLLGLIQPDLLEDDLYRLRG